MIEGLDELRPEETVQLGACWAVGDRRRLFMLSILMFRSKVRKGSMVVRNEDSFRTPLRLGRESFASLMSIHLSIGPFQG